MFANDEERCPMSINHDLSPTAELEALRHRVAELERQLAASSAAPALAHAAQPLAACMFDHVPAHMLMLDLEGRIARASRFLLRQIQRDGRDLIGQPIEAIFPAELCAQSRADMQQIVALGAPVTRQVTCPFGGEEGMPPATQLQTLFPILDAAGTLTAFGVLVNDISALKQAEQQLEQQLEEQTAELLDANRLLQFHLENSPLGIIEWDSDLRVRHWSTQAERVFGWTKEEVLGKRSDEWGFIYETDAADVAQQVRQMLNGTVTRITGRNRNYTRDGRVIECEWYNSVLLGEDGTPLSLFSMVQDVSAQQRAREALAASESRYHLLVKHVPNAEVYLFDHDLRYHVVGGAGLASLGITPEMFEGKTIWEVVDPETCAIIEPYYRAALAGETNTCEIEYQGMLYEMHAVPVRDKQGNVVAGMVTTQNITESRRTERALRQSEERLQRMAQHMPVLLDAFDEAGNIVLWNAECERVTGYRADEIMGNPRAMELLYPDPDYRAKVIAEWSSIGHNYRDWEWNLTAKDGTTRTIAWSNISGNVPLPGWVTWGIGVDVTQRRQAEAALEAERASLARRVAERTADLSVANAELARAVRTKDEFLANMSHELRTPLNAILGLSEALQEGVYGALNTRQLSSLHTIEESGRHLLDLINDILDLSKIEAGKAEMHPEAFGLESLCQASLRMVRQTAMKKHLTVAESIDPAVETFYTDQRRLKQMLVNLLSNAVKFTPERGTIGLEVVGDAEQQAVHFTVWDTGIGIKPEQLSRLFKPFVQIDSGLSRQHQGSGLGLSLVARLAEMNGGSVAVQSEEGKGSRFTITLPWRSEAQDVSGAAEEAMTVSLQKAPLKRALLIEDSPTAADQMTRYLAGLQVETVLIARGGEAVAQALALQPDVIILDILLPDVSGWDVLAALKAEPRTQHIPVVVVSVVDSAAQARELGAVAALLKPITRAQLHQALGAVFPQAFVAALQSSLTKILPDEEIVPPMEEVPPLILLAEDNEENIQVLSDYLGIRGYRVTVARNGGEAIARAHEEHPRLILMDIQMPGIDGLTAIRRLRADSKMEEVPIIALTALAMPGDHERCLEAGANDYMSKPVRLKHLTQSIERYLLGVA
jgi:PAS domain S-box-containing protein